MDGHLDVDSLKKPFLYGLKQRLYPNRRWLRYLSELPIEEAPVAPTVWTASTFLERTAYYEQMLATTRQQQRLIDQMTPFVKTGSYPAAKPFPRRPCRPCESTIARVRDDGFDW